MSKFRSSKGKNAPIQFLGTFLIILFVRVECFTTPPPGNNDESGGVRPQSHLQDSRPVLVSKDDLIEGITDDRHGNRLTNGNSSWQEPGRDARTIPLYLKGSGSEEDERVKTRDKRATKDAEFRKYGIMVSDAAIYLQHHKWFDYDHRFETRDPNHKKKAQAKVVSDHVSLCPSLSYCRSTGTGNFATATCPPLCFLQFARGECQKLWKGY